MECERLIKLIKNWYVQVQDEAMAPARMVDFMRTHLDTCPVCMGDPVVDGEIKKIIEIILPAKSTKFVRAEADGEESGDTEEYDESDEVTDDVEDEEGDEEVAEDLDEEEAEDLDDDDDF